MNDPKSVLESKTFWGLVVTLITPLLAKHGVIVDPTSWGVDIATLFGAGLALYGRVTAKQGIELKP